MKKSKILYVDQDDVLADFYKATWDNQTQRVQEELMWEPDFFLNLEPMLGSQHGIYMLQKMGFDVRILTQPLAGHPECYYDKALWVQKYFPSLTNKLILTQDKGLNLGHYLVDDNLEKWKEKFEQNGGKFVHFPYGGYNRHLFPDSAYKKEHWPRVIDYFSKEDPYLD